MKFACPIWIAMFLMIKKICILALIFTVYSCELQKENRSYTDLFDEQTEIILAEVYPELVDSLRQPDMLLACSKFLIFSEPQLPMLLMGYNTETGDIRRILPHGQGQNEALAIQTIGMGSEAASFYAYDLSLSSVFHFSQKGDSISFVKTDDRAPKHSSCAVAYDGDTAFFLNIADEKRFTCYHGKDIIKFGDMVNIPNLSPVAVSHALQGPCLINSSAKKIAWFSIYGDIMEIYDYADINHIKLELSNLITPPIFVTATAATGVMSPKTKLSVSSVVSDGKYIYALYNEKTLLEIMQNGNREQAFFADKILVWDWQGNACKILQLNKQVKSITYSPSENKIFCLGLDSNLDYALYGFPVIE